MGYAIVTPKRETEKAVLVEYIYYVDTLNPDAEYKTTAWLPKSQIDVYHVFAKGDVAYKVPAWLARKRGIITVKKAIVDELVEHDINNR